MVQKIYSKVHLVSCTNTHRDVTDLANYEMVKNTKTWISWERNIMFVQNKKILNLYFRWHILRSYRFVAEVTFKAFSCNAFFYLVFCCGTPTQGGSKLWRNESFHFYLSFIKGHIFRNPRESVRFLAYLFPKFINIVFECQPWIKSVSLRVTFNITFLAGF